MSFLGIEVRAATGSLDWISRIDSLPATRRSTLSLTEAETMLRRVEPLSFRFDRLSEETFIVVHFRAGPDDRGREDLHPHRREQRSTFVSVALPPAATLRRFAEMAKERGIALILVKEPISKDRPRVWKSEFREVMDQIGREYRLEVADPTPAIQAVGGGRLFMDEVHPYSTGHRVAAIALAPIVSRVLAGRAK